jgi:hypothetical protein
VDERVGVLVRGDVHERLRAAGCALGGEIGEFNRGRHAFPRVVHRRQAIEPCVGYFRDADRCLALAVRAARRFTRAGHELKQGGFAAGAEANERCPEHQ